MRDYRTNLESPYRQVLYPWVATAQNLYGECPYLDATLFYPPSPKLTLESGLFAPFSWGWSTQDITTLRTSWGPVFLSDELHPLATWQAQIDIYRNYFPGGETDVLINYRILFVTLSFPWILNPERIWRGQYWLKNGIPAQQSFVVQEDLTTTPGGILFTKFDQEPE